MTQPVKRKPMRLVPNPELPEGMMVAVTPARTIRVYIAGRGAVNWDDLPARTVCYVDPVSYLRMREATDAARAAQDAAASRMN